MAMANNKIWLLAMVALFLLLALFFYAFNGSASSIVEFTSVQHERASMLMERTSIQLERVAFMQERNSFHDDFINLQAQVAMLKSALDCPTIHSKVDPDVLPNPRPVKIKAVSELTPYITKNRETVNKIPNWIDEEVYNKSLFQYGLPSYVRDLIDKPLGSAPTYTDVLSYLSNEYLPHRKAYLEIGVSVGKTFYQMANNLDNSYLYAFELENINPILESLFESPRQVAEWPSQGTARIEPAKFTEYQLPSNQNTIYYLTSDVYQRESWYNLKGEKFDIIFSDGLHSPDAILYELDMILQLDLLDHRHFFLWYDDLGGDMSKGFFSNFMRLKQHFPFLGKDNIALVRVNGWLGENEGEHLNGIISTFNLTRILEELE